MSRRASPRTEGQAAQVRAVLAAADEPLTVEEIGRRARIVWPGARPLRDLPAGNPGRACYRILVRLERDGLAERDREGGGNGPHLWTATDQLRRRMRDVAVEMATRYALPALDRNAPDSSLNPPNGD